jgi:hypothetical protein
MSMARGVAEGLLDGEPISAARYREVAEILGRAARIADTSFEPHFMLQTMELQASLSSLVYALARPDSVDLLREDKERLLRRIADTQGFGPKLLFQILGAQLDFMISHRTGDRTGMAAAYKAAETCRARAAEGGEEQLKEEISALLLDMQVDMMRLDGQPISSDKDFIGLQPST